MSSYLDAATAVDFVAWVVLNVEICVTDGSVAGVVVNVEHCVTDGSVAGVVVNVEICASPYASSVHWVAGILSFNIVVRGTPSALAAAGFRVWRELLLLPLFQHCGTYENVCDDDAE